MLPGCKSDTGNGSQTIAVNTDVPGNDCSILSPAAIVNSFLGNRRNQHDIDDRPLEYAISEGVSQNSTEEATALGYADNIALVVVTIIADKVWLESRGLTLKWSSLPSAAKVCSHLNWEPHHNVQACSQILGSDDRHKPQFYPTITNVTNHPRRLWI